MSTDSITQPPDCPIAEANESDDIGNSKPEHSACAPKPSVAQTDWNESDEDLEPGDDIGNRAGGPAHHERTITSEESVEQAAGKSRRRRRGKPAGAENAPPAAVNAGADAARKGRKGQRNPGGQAHARERPAFRIGEEVFGKVTQITPDAVWIDLSGKAQAIFDSSELPADGLPQPGDHFVATVHGDGSRGGFVVLTRNPPRVDQGKLLVQQASESGDLVEGLVTGAIKGGVEVDVCGLRAFAPGSHVDLKLGADLHYLVGQRLSFKVLSYAKNGREVVLTRRELLEKQATDNRMAALAELQPGQVVGAVVRSVVDWGVFVAIPSAGNVEGLVHMTEASHDRNSKLGDLFHAGDQLDVKVLRIDENGKLWLSRKAASVDPWETAASAFRVGTRHTGRVARLQPFGAFIELAPDIDGLIRTSDLSMRKINDPSEAVVIGDEINVVVVHFDPSAHKIGLHPAPDTNEHEQPQKVAPHRVLKVKVVSTEPGGLLVRIMGVTGGGARGFIPAGLTGTVRGTDLRREFPVGMELEAKAIEVDPRRGECKLSIRALKDDSEKAAYTEYRASVAREGKFGTFGDLFAKRGNNS